LSEGAIEFNKSSGQVKDDLIKEKKQQQLDQRNADHASNRLGYRKAGAMKRSNSFAVQLERHGDLKDHQQIMKIFDELRENGR
jgi:hypothetical protein